MFCICISTHQMQETVYAQSTPALMDLLDRWAPAMQSAAIVGVLGDLNEFADRGSFAQLVAEALRTAAG